MQAWKFAKGLYLIPFFMVYNPEIILGGPVLYVVFTGLIAILALAAFAAAIEGYLFAPMDPFSRLLIVPSTIAVFHPMLQIETAGAAALTVLLALNWIKGRQPAPPVGGRAD